MAIATAPDTSCAPIQVARPRLPPAHSLLPYLREIDTNAWYANHGPLAQTLQQRLAAFWNLAAAEVALLSNATAGLTLALRASGARPGSRCLMPSWTFVASAGAVRAAGLIPHFVDVCPGSWAPDPAEILSLAARHDIGGILVVSPFGAPLDLAAWDAVQAATGLPVIIDGAAAFDTLRADGPMPALRCPVLVSLHATKVFGIGEGGALLCRDPELMQRVRALAQFGFSGTREAILPGINAKLSEYTAAVGLAGLDAWAETRARWDSATQRYRALLPDAIALPPAFGSSWVSSTLNVLWPEDRPDLTTALAAQGVATLRWWGPGCHAQPAFQSCPAEPLPVTELYARRAIGLPFWQDLSDAQIRQVCQATRRLLDRTSAAKRRPVTTLVPAWA
ncbi:MAG: DegT/DnrJ/EryC1/StrS family aminotransferase [Acetobacteraceae bacterium]